MTLLQIFFRAVYQQFSWPRANPFRALRLPAMLAAGHRWRPVWDAAGRKPLATEVDLVAENASSIAPLEARLTSFLATRYFSERSVFKTLPIVLW